MKRRMLLIATGLWLALTMPDAGQYPQDYFQSPVDFPIRLSGTFGELRPGHFHSGMDIKPSTPGSGDPVLAAADGQIVRISVGAGGYGNALYIQHSNGYQTVYGHMRQFIPEIDAYVLKEQYRLQSFEVNLYPPAGTFVVKQGEQIGVLGNSGSSSAAHLHFEVRSASAEPINPAHFGISVDDRTKPRIYHLALYTRRGERPHLVRQIPVINGRLPDTIDWDYADLALGVEAYDLANGATNKNGIYSLQLMADSVTRFAMHFDRFAFSETRYLNAHKDYSQWVQNGQTIHRLHKLPGDHFSGRSKQDGWVAVEPGQSIRLDLAVGDAFGNVARLHTQIRAGELKVMIPPDQTDVQFIYRGQAREWNTDGFHVALPAHLLYSSTPIRYNTLDDPSSGVYSRVHDFHDPHDPVHRYYTLGIQPTNLPEVDRNKATIIYCDPDGREVSMGGEWDHGELVTKVRDFGQFYVGMDTVPPRIEPVEFSNLWQPNREIKFKITDNLVTSGQAQSLRFTVTIDGAWYLATFDQKKDLVECSYSKPLTSGKHVFRLVVLDDRENKTVWEKTFSTP